MPGRRRQQLDPVVAELQQIKGLLILLLLKAGASSEEIALATGSGASTIRRDFPSQQLAPFGAGPKRAAKT